MPPFELGRWRWECQAAHSLTLLRGQDVAVRRRLLCPNKQGRKDHMFQRVHLFELLKEVRSVLDLGRPGGSLVVLDLG